MLCRAMLYCTTPCCTILLLLLSCSTMEHAALCLGALCKAVHHDVPHRTTASCRATLHRVTVLCHTFRELALSWLPGAGSVHWDSVW